MSFNITLAVLAAIAGLAASSAEGDVPIASPTHPSIYSPTHPSDGSVRRGSAMKRRAVVDKREKDTVQSINNPTSSPVPKARFSSPTPPADYPPLEDSVRATNKPTEAAQTDVNARNDLEIYAMNRTCDEDCLQEGVEEMEAQDAVNTTEELGAPVDVNARNQEGMEEMEVQDAVTTTRELEASVDVQAQNDLEINVMNRTCGSHPVEQEFVNMTEELEPPVDVNARYHLEINVIKPKEISPGIAVTETTVETTESAHAKIFYTPTPSPSPKDMFMSPTPPVDVQESSVSAPGPAKHGSVIEVVNAPIGLEVVHSNRTDDEERCYEECPFGEGSHCGLGAKAVEDWKRIVATEASYERNQYI